ncbi:MAG: metal-dependent transcriptional regulator [Clostridia bacterium]|nr:metal-dependent transcriptional regulator [Clostridia bacterium]
MAIHESGEMYLEAIYVLSKSSSCVRSIDVADYLGYSKPSVSRAISLLKSENYVYSDKSGFLFLTDKGSTVAGKIYERHTILTSFFISLGVDEETAANDACKIEHCISDASLEAIKKHTNK